MMVAALPLPCMTNCPNNVNALDVLGTGQYIELRFSVEPNLKWYKS
jgi:hypothetical protein